MMNQLSKGLVLLHVAFSVASMTWAILLVIQARDFGWVEPYKEVLEWTKDGAEKSFVRHPSEYDKSWAALKEAAQTRDLTYTHVKPALESLGETEPYLPGNHLFYVAEFQRLREGPDKIEVKRLKDGGMALDPPNSPLGKPTFNENKVDGIGKSYKSYEADLKKLFKEIDEEEAEIRKIVVSSKKYANELTGTVEDPDDPLKKPAVYVHPGLYQLIDLEFKALSQIKIETDNIKPNWSKAVEQSRLFQYRRADLEATLEKLQVPEPKNAKKNGAK